MSNESVTKYFIRKFYRLNYLASIKFNAKFARVIKPLDEIFYYHPKSYYMATMMDFRQKQYRSDVKRDRFNVGHRSYEILRPEFRWHTSVFHEANNRETIFRGLFV